ncbi:MAG: hypothetical protein AAGE13_12180 [Pseudomonadota bacterium]
MIFTSADMLVIAERNGAESIALIAASGTIEAEDIDGSVLLFS